MGHNPANRDVKKSERKQAEEKRTPADIIKGIRGNLAAHLAVTPNDISFLLISFVGQQLANTILDGDLKQARETVALQAAHIADLEAKIEEFRSVYEQENRSTTVEIFSSFAGAEPEVIDHGGEA